MKNFWIICLCLVSNIFADVAVPFVNFSAFRSPVERPREVLFSGHGAMVSTDGSDQKVLLTTDQIFGEHISWTVTGRKGGYSTLRTVLPPIEQANTTSGVRIELHSEQSVDIIVEVFSGSDPIAGFDKAKRIGHFKKTIEPGKQIFDLRWKEGKVNDLKAVRGFGIVIPEASARIRLLGYEFLFESQSQADVYLKTKKRKNRVLQKAMVDSLTGRNIDLNKVFKKTSGLELEEKIWQGVKLSAIFEQLSNWQRLGQKYSKGGRSGLRLLKRQAKLAKSLENGVAKQADIEKLQIDSDKFVDSIRGSLTPDQRRWYIGKDKRFHRPDDRNYKMFGPFFHRSRFITGTTEIMAWKPEDLEYLAGIGFNGLRFSVCWANLEPDSWGQFDLLYLKSIKDIISGAEKYGMGVGIDLHWSWPEWYIKGKPGQESSVKDKDSNQKQNLYHWDDPVVDCFRRLAIELKDNPNIFVWEVPGNEPTIGASEYGLYEYPALIEMWNNWLKETYQTRENINAAWGQGQFSQRYILQDNEDWEEGTIKPLGWQEDPDVDTAYENNPRVWDHVRFCGYLQTKLSGKIMDAVRQTLPNAEGIMQFTIGDWHDKSPIPIYYQAIQTVMGDNVNPATHYGVGGFRVRKVYPRTFISYDSECGLNNAWDRVKQNVDWGIGFSPFDFFYFAGGEMLFGDHSGKMVPSAAYMFKKSDYIRNHWPDDLVSGKFKVAVLTNTRLSATFGKLVRDIPEMLEQEDCYVGVFEALAVVQRPFLIDDYDLVITSSTYMDTELLKVLDERFKGKILLFGTLDRDAFAKNAENGLARALVERGILLKNSAIARLSDKEKGTIDLEGNWDWCFAGKGSGTRKPSDTTGKEWIQRVVPDRWGEVRQLGSRQYYLGDGWYKRKVFIPKQWEGRTMNFQIGAIDDEDWTFFNGQYIGKTTGRGKYLVPRSYTIKPELVKWGQENEIMVCDINTFADGGMYKSPVRLVVSVMADLWWRQQRIGRLNLGRFSQKITKDDLLNETQILAEVKIDQKGSFAAFVNQNRWYWWVDSSAWDKDSEFQTKVIKEIFGNVSR